MPKIAKAITRNKKAFKIYTNSIFCDISKKKTKNVRQRASRKAFRYLNKGRRTPTGQVF